MAILVVEDLVGNGKYSVLFRKGIIDQNLLKHESVKELLEYTHNKDANLERVKVLITRANKDLRMNGLYIYVKKSFDWDKEAQNRICIIRRR